MRLYHGSNVRIEHIDLAKSLKGKDFGQGFYLTEDLNQAENIAKIRCLGTDDSPVVNVYDFDEAKLLSGDLKFLAFDNYTPQWAEFVLANRRNDSDRAIHDYDVVYGPIANDRVGQQIRRLLDEEITMLEFIERLKYMKGITFQYFFGTEKAVEMLRPV